MIQHVVERCNQSAASSVVVATDHNRIVEVVKGFGGTAVLTSTDHPSGSDRIAEASRILGLENQEIIVNVQGDEPDMPAALIDQVAVALASDSGASMATASTLLEDRSQVTDPSVVKVVTDRNGYAIYFSRATIPWVRGENSSQLAESALQHGRRHLGIYAYRAGYIKEFAARGSCELENLEKLEQLRGIWYGDRILCVDAVQTPGPGIDTEQDLEQARKAIS
jgi:3-deoxy-manno-octulosonate cytidylyltransferase (CMP-KDO synthetase)